MTARNRLEGLHGLLATHPGRLAHYLGPAFRGEYLEMPGLSLTAIQAQRLWGLDGDACGLLLEALLQSGFLRRTTQGEYVRTSAA